MSVVADVVIPTFNQSAMTLACLRSLNATPDLGRIRVIWVDNGSDPGERLLVRSYLESEFLAAADWLFIRENLGFVKATNAGIAISTAPYVLLLNNDTELPPEWLDRFLEVLSEEPIIAAVGPRSSSPHQWQGRIPTEGVYVDAKAGFLETHQMLSFFCTMFRREALERCGYLSEEYKAGLGDDDDYCERLHRAGYRLAIRLDTTVTHHHRTTFKAVYGEAGYEEMQRVNIAFFRRKWGKP